MKKKLALLLAIVMVVSMFPLTTFAAATKPNVTISVDKTEVSVGDTITVKLGITEMNASSIALGFYFDNTLLEATSVTKKPKFDYTYWDEDEEDWIDDDTNATSVSTVDEANASGYVGVVLAGATEETYVEKENIVTVKFTAKENGTVNFLLKEDSSGTDGYKKDKMESGVSVTIGSSEPSCAHPTTKIVSNGNGTHNVVCADTTCGAIVTENVNCTGTDDGNCTTAVTCECGYVITAAKTSHTGGTATCTAMAKCADCGTEYGNLGDHSYGELISAQEAVHTEEELTAGVAAYYQCSVCSKYFTESKDETTLEDLTGETPAHAEDPSKTTIETESASCTEEGKTVTKTFCSCGLLLNSTTTPADPLGHTWGTTTYDWSADYNTCTATRVCATDPNHTETETVNTTSEINTPGTCTSEEVCTYTADFTADWAADQTQEVTGEKDPNNHTYDENNHECVCGANIHVFATVIERGEVTCTEESYIIYACDCGAQERRVFDAPGHAPVLVPKDDFTHVALCCVCLEPLGDPEPHTYDETTHECACGASAHLFEETYREDETCTEEGYVIFACDCGAEKREVLDASGHKPVLAPKDDFTHFEQCCVCAETLGDPEPHTYDETTHECVCGAVETYKLKVGVFYLDESDGKFHGYVIGNSVMIDVPYGARIADYIPDTVEFDGVTYDVTDVGVKIYLNNPEFNGYYTVTGWFAGEFHEFENAPAVPEYMPANDLTISQSAVFTGWYMTLDEKSGEIIGTAYMVNGEFVTGWTQIDGSWYYFDETTYYRAEGLTRVPYPTVEINGITYAADAEAVAYCASKGTTFIDATEAWFLFGEDGKFSYETIGVVGDHYYVNGMQTWHPGLVEFAPDNYYFIGDVVNGGNIGANGDTYITKNNGNATFAIGEIYNFVNGKLSGAHGVVDGKYYQNSKLMMGYGLVKTDNGFIFVRSSGELATGKYYITNVKNYTGTELGYGYGVTFGADGYAINGIHDGKYYVNGLVAYGAGAVKTDAGYIYVRSNGVVVKNTTYWITTVGETGLVAKQYTFDANGIMQNPEFVAEQLNGIHNGYYYENGNIVYGAGLIEYNGGYIYVRSNGMVATGKYWVTNANDLMESNYYTFGEDGMMIN